MRVTVLREIPEDERLGKNWNQLVQRMERPEVFFTYEWALAVSRAFRGTLSPVLVLVHEADELCGVAALTIVESHASASFLNAGTADYCDIVSAPETCATVLSCLMGEIANLQIQHLTLANVPAGSPTWKVIPAVARAQHFHMASRPAYECGLVEFGDEQQRRTMLDAVIHTSKGKRAFKKLSMLGTVRTRDLATIDEVKQSLPHIISAQVSRFLATGRVSPLLQSGRRVFLHELASLLHSKQWLKISQLEIDGQAIAWNYGFRFQSSWFWYLPTFRVDYKDYSPGAYLLRSLIEQGCAEPSLGRLDLGLGDETYKSRFATATFKSREIHLSRALSQHAWIVIRQFITTGAVRFPNAAARLRRARQGVRSLFSRLQSNALKFTIANAGKRLAHLFWSRDEVLLFEAREANSAGNSTVHLDAVTWENLSEAALEYAGDADTVQYLLRYAARLQAGLTTGFLLRDQEHRAVHFLSVAKLDGFHLTEIDYTMRPADVPDGMMIFDCWTPVQCRKQGYYSLAIRLTSEVLNRGAKKAWIFCASSNKPSMKGILKAAFTYRFSLVRKRRLGVSSNIIRSDKMSTYEVHS